MYREIPHALSRALAFYLSALMLWIIANSFPFLGLEAAGIVEESRLMTGALAMQAAGMPLLGAAVFLTSIAFPLITICGMVYLLLPLAWGLVPPMRGAVVRLVSSLEPWSLLGVFFLGTLIAVVKLQDLATVVPGLGLFAFAGLLLVYTGARASLDPECLWPDRPNMTGEDAARYRALLNCHTCGMLHPASRENPGCIRCGARLHHRTENSVQRTWALLISATLMLIPANIYPVMTVTQLGRGEPSTILSGIIHLMEAGLWGLGFIVLFASIVVPVAKIVTLGLLLVSVQHRWQWRPRDRTALYRITEVIGAWSMVDVFLVALLGGLVSLGLLANIQPGIGATFFGAAVVLTMLAAHSFDPRLIWDNSVGRPAAGSGAP